MDEPEGYKAPIFTVLTKFFTIGGVRREQAAGLAMFCAGLGWYFRSWLAIGVFLLGYGGLVLATWRDPLWLEILWETLRYFFRLRRRHQLRVVYDAEVDPLDDEEESPR